jgi:4-amino-4-deoxy-L-arabinose transferase-like glycosyltransferase
MPSTFRRDAIIVIVALALPLLYIAAAGGGFPLDDSWIHQTYARNLAQYGEWSFTLGTPSTASTSPLYTLMLAVGHKLGVPVGIWTHGLGILCLALAGLIAARMAERLAPNVRSIGLYAGLAVVAAWHLVWAAASGMETMVFSLFTLLLPYLAWRELDYTPAHNPLRHALEKGAIRLYLVRGAVFGVAAGLATLARPEGAMLVGLLGLALVVARPGMSWRALFVYGGAAVVAFALVLAPYLLFNLQVTGGLLPNTAASKRADLVFLFQRPYLQRVIDLLTPLSAGGQILLLPGAVVFAVAQLRGARQDRHRWLLLVPLIWSVGLVLLYASYLPAFFQHGRYVIPSLPAFIVCGVVGTFEIVRRERRTLVRRVLARGLVMATVAVYALMAVVLGLQTYASDVEIIDSEMVMAARWIAENVPQGELMAIHDIGAVGYFASRPIIDLAGLVSPELLPVIPVELNGEAVWAILRERDARYVMGFADQVPGGDPHDSRLCAVFRARGQTAEVSDTYNMSIYRITWDGNCPD